MYMLYVISKQGLVLVAHASFMTILCTVISRCSTSKYDNYMIQIPEFNPGWGSNITCNY